MADIPLIIKSLTRITTIKYDGQASSRKTLRQICFERLQGSAKGIAVILTQNPNPDSDSRENIQGLFDSLKKDLKEYSQNSPDAAALLKAFNAASVEWGLFLNND